MTTDTALWVFRQSLPEALARLRAAMADQGCYAVPGPELDAEAERIAREDRKDTP